MRTIRFYLALVAMICLSVATAMAQSFGVTGRVLNSESEPIAYATVVALKNGTQAAGGATNDRGEFTLNLTSGEYTFNISYLGYRTAERTATISEPTSLGDIVLEADSEQIDEVVVTAQLIRREADRFIVDVANSPAAVGKDGEELLKSAPGVWIQDDEISINGASGSKVYINDREVRLDDEQLISYLRTLRAEDIQRIEVVPQTGADYDAASSGGIIKITTKRRIDSGFMGSASLSVGGTKGQFNVNPSLSLNYNSGNINAYGRLWGGYSASSYSTEEHTDYASGTVIDAASALDGNSRYGGGNAGVVYDITPRHSIGAELQYNYWGSDDITDTWTERSFNNETTRTDGDYSSSSGSHMVTTTLNYIYKLDDNGSTLKLIGDYTDSQSPSSNRYFDTSFLMSMPTVSRDSTYRNRFDSHYRLATATVALEQVLSPKVTLRAGLKYTYNTNINTADYEYLSDETWLPNTEHSYNIGYTENIGAAYVTASARLGRVSLVGGLRGEYTAFDSEDGSVNQRYFGLFPNANASVSLSEDGAYSLIAQYSRSISRPSFWALSPNETKISEYMIQRGNPNLKPSYNNTLSITAVLKYKYTISFGMSIMQDAIQQATLVDSKNPEVLIIQTINYPTLNNYYASVNLPFQFTSWWAANFNLTGMYMGQRIYPEEPVRRHFMSFSNAQMTFTLPQNFIIELSGNYMQGLRAGNTRIGNMGNMHITLKKRMFDNKLTISLGARNLIPVAQRIYIEENDFERVMLNDQPWNRLSASFSISYNFNSGKNFRAKSVESGSEEDRGRISSN